jgi:hypothetical protein
MPRPDMISIDFARELDERLEKCVPKNLQGQRRTRQRVEFVIGLFLDLPQNKADVATTPST